MSEFLEDGHATYYTFSNAPAILLKEVETTPPGIGGGGGIDQTTMRNVAWRTGAPKKLKTFKVGKTTAAYDPAVYVTIIANVSINQLITLTFPDGDTIDFWGCIDDFQPNGHKEGDRPLADVEIYPTLMDDDQLETPPVYTAAP